MDAQGYVKLNQAAKFFNVSIRTIYRWKDSGNISYITTPSGHYLYKIKDMPRSEKIKVIYIRVSSNKQTNDLERQKTFASEQFPSHQIISDVGSGLNFKRRGLRKLLKMVLSNRVEEIIITSKDRLCRFGYDLIEWLCDENDTKILVLDKDSGMSKESEFVRDVLSIIQIYTCKWNGQRRYNNKSKENKTTINKSSETTVTNVE
jgi:putative resolvase